MVYNLFVFAVTFHSYHLAYIHLLMGYSSQKSIDFLLNPFCIQFVTTYLSACYFAIMYLDKAIKFKPKCVICCSRDGRFKS